MTLFEEVQQLASESHEKWFERYCNKINLENRIKTLAAQGKTSGIVSVDDRGGDYLKERLLNPKTIDMLRDRLGEDFSVELKTETIESTVSAFFDRTKTYIEISW
ncbi:TPA: hypothetical protein ACJS2L_002041 [Streptococcus agalactiae]